MRGFEGLGEFEFDEFWDLDAFLVPGSDSATLLCRYLCIPEDVVSVQQQVFLVD
jgi:hypothetical protein